MLIVHTYEPKDILVPLGEGISIFKYNYWYYYKKELKIYTNTSSGWVEFISRTFQRDYNQLEKNQ